MAFDFADHPEFIDFGFRTKEEAVEKAREALGVVLAYCDGLWLDADDPEAKEPNFFGIGSVTGDQMLDHEGDWIFVC